MRLFVTTMPKTGTHLLLQILTPYKWMPQVEGYTYINFLYNHNVIGKKSGGRAKKATLRYLNSYDGKVCAHLPYDIEFLEALKNKPTYIVQLIRDPRDTALALYHNALAGARQNYFNIEFSDGSVLSEKDDPLWWAIKLSPDWWKGWTPWIENKIPDLILRYEDLIGPNIRNVLQPIADNIEGFNIDIAISNINPQTSKTFRRGIAGGWKEEFKPHHIKLVEEILGPTMEILGYGSNS